MTTETPTVCPSCGYNAPHHGWDCPRDNVVFRCPDHAPATYVKRLGFDDGRARCGTCGTYGGHVTPYRVTSPTGSAR